MNAGVVSLVLLAALLHSGWNAIAKAIPDRLVSSTLIGIIHLIVGGIAVFFCPVPRAEAWPALILSAVLQTTYMLLLTAAYARSEFGRVYPLTRGVAVIGVTGASAVLLHESLLPVQLCGVAIVSAALLLLAFSGPGQNRSGLLIATGVGVIVATYSLVDGLGVRQSGTALGYAAWLFLIQGVTIPLLCLGLARDRRAYRQGLRRHALRGGGGGVLAVTAYGIVLWAQSVAPLALVSALRETGVLMAVLIGWLFFRERLRPSGIVATAAAVVGILLVRAAI